MIDSVTQERMVVYTGENAGPYIMVPVEQLETVTMMLTEDGISHWVDSAAISLNGRPEVTVINLARGTDAEHVQRLLDAAG